MDYILYSLTVRPINVNAGAERTQEETENGTKDADTYRYAWKRKFIKTCHYQISFFIVEAVD